MAKTGTLYTGMTGFIDTRIFQHKTGAYDGFTISFRICHMIDEY